MVKVTISTEPQRKEIPFPKLMVSKEGRIVFFLRPCVGTKIYHAGEIEDIFWYSEGWLMENFTDFTGSITLSNETPAS